MKLICLAGPTGTGKSRLALQLAESLRGAIVNADSRQVYRDFRLITARPTQQEESRCPHVLYGFLETEKKISAGVWAQMAAGQIAALREQALLPILTGGTGLYLRALLDGMADIPAVPPEITARLTGECAAKGPECLHAELLRLDPAYAARIHPRDRQRIVRALEVYEATGRTFSWWHGQTPPPPAADVLRVGLALPLDELTPRLERRIEAMLKAGALEEAREAFARCPDPLAPGWSGIGCAELLAVLRGELNPDAAKALWLKNTRAYAKRQLTWFRADPRILWFEPDQTEQACAVAESWLGQ